MTGATVQKHCCRLKDANLFKFEGLIVFSTVNFNCVEAESVCLRSDISSDEKTAREGQRRSKVPRQNCVLTHVQVKVTN